MKRHLMIIAISLNFALLLAVNGYVFIALLLIAGTCFLFKGSKVPVYLLMALSILVFMVMCLKTSQQSYEIDAMGMVHLDGYTATVTVDGISGKILFNNWKTNFFDGQSVWVKGTKVSIDDERYYSMNIYAELEIDEMVDLPSKPSMRSRLSGKMLEHFEKRFGSGGVILYAMMLGNRQVLEKSTCEVFTALGLAHLLAVSGFHIGIIGYTFDKLMKQMGIFRFIRKGIVLMILSMISYLSGLHVSVIRALGQYLVREGAFHTNRRYDSLSALALISIILMIRNPYVVLSLGYRLSFIAAFSIAWFRKFPVIIRVYIGIFPLLLALDPQFNLLTIPINMIMVIFMGMMLPGGILLAILPVKIPLICWGYGLILNNLTKVLAFFSNWEILWIDGPVMTDLQLSIYYTFFFLIVILSEFSEAEETLSHYKWVIAALVLLSCFMGGRGYQRMFDNSIAFIDVGSGDAALVSYEGIRVLVDAGDGYAVAEFLEGLSIRYLDAVMISHAHRDHYGGLYYLDDMRVECLYIEDKTILNDLEIGYNQVEMITKGTKLAAGSFSITALWPPVNLSDSEENNHSQVLLIQMGDVTVLFTGDIFAEVEKNLSVKNVDILKVAHHGAKTSNCLEFLENVSPTIAVVSVGKKDPYGHPDPEVMERLDAVSERVFTTMHSGTLILKPSTNGIQYKELK
jgi:competence protein ComEC